ncbi:MAG: hypothetical protein GEU80_03235 [Dehalococcoidia bacterium]|nr:hypothetical protein [Dehalococcoidia bacterium]
MAGWDEHDLFWLKSALGDVRSDWYGTDLYELLQWDEARDGNPDNGWHYVPEQGMAPQAPGTGAEVGQRFAFLGMNPLLLAAVVVGALLLTVLVSVLFLSGGGDDTALVAGGGAGTPTVEATDAPAASTSQSVAETPVVAAPAFSVSPIEATFFQERFTTEYDVLVSTFEVPADLTFEWTGADCGQYGQPDPVGRPQLFAWVHPLIRHVTRRPSTRTERSKWL